MLSKHILYRGRKSLQKSV